ncbi:MAG: hypothetical protein H7844_03895 [Nitrospirae bacterium YQR-1]
MNIRVSGGGFVTANGFGKLNDTLPLPLKKGTVEMPAVEQLFAKTGMPARFGRFDSFTKMGFAGAALALDDAGYRADKGSICGMIVASFYDTVNTDKAYYETTLEQDGFLSSPNLFSYTLPVIILGECCIVFSITGPAFCVGNERGREGLTALKNAVRLIESGKAAQMLVGWVDDPPQETDDPPVSIFVFLEGNVGDTDSKIIMHDWGCLSNGLNTEITSIMDLFKGETSRSFRRSQQS